MARCQDGRTYVASCLAAAEITRADGVIVQRAVVVNGGVALLGWHGRDWQILEVLLGVGHLGWIYAPAGGETQLLLVDHGALRQARTSDPLVQPQWAGQLQQHNVTTVEELLVFGLGRKNHQGQVNSKLSETSALTNLWIRYNPLNLYNLERAVAATAGHQRGVEMRRASEEHPVQLGHVSVVDELGFAHDA